MTIIASNQRDWGRVHCFPPQQRPWTEMLDPGSTAVREGTYLLPSEVLASAPGGVLFPTKPMVRVYRDHQDKQSLCLQEVPAWGTAGPYPGDGSTRLVGPEQGISGSKNGTRSKLKGQWSARMSNLSSLPAGSQGCGGRWGMKESHVAFSLRTYLTQAAAVRIDSFQGFDLTQHTLHAYRCPWSSPGNLPHRDISCSFDRGVVKREEKKDMKTGQRKMKWLIQNHVIVGGTVTARRHMSCFIHH